MKKLLILLLLPTLAVSQETILSSKKELKKNVNYINVQAPEIPTDYSNEKSGDIFEYAKILPVNINLINMT